MSATAEDLRGADLNGKDRMDETVAYEPNASSASGPEDPMGSSDMPNANSSSHGTRSLQLRLRCPAARWLHDQACHRARGLRRGLLRHLRFRQGSGAQADPAQSRRRAARSRALHEPEVPELADDLRSEGKRRRRHVRRHGICRRPQPGQRLEAVPRRSAAARGSPLAQGTGRRGRLPARSRNRSPRSRSRPICSWRKGSSRSATTAWPS